MTMTAAKLTAQRDLDRIELSLIALLNAEARISNAYTPATPWHFRDAFGPGRQVSLDIWKFLRMPPMRPRAPWLFGWHRSGEIIGTHDVTLLPAPVPFLLGTEFESAIYLGEILDDGTLLRYNALKAVHRVPRPYRAIVPGQYYLRCVREITNSGAETCQLAMLGWSRNGGFAPVVYPGMPLNHQLTPEQREEEYLTLLTLASLAAYVSGRWEVRLSQTTSVRLATDAYGIRHLAQLRDNPRTDSGRLRPIVHWVRAHLRRSPRYEMDVVEVRQHLRGITQFHLGDIDVAIHEPRAASVWPDKTMLTLED